MVTKTLRECAVTVAVPEASKVVPPPVWRSDMTFGPVFHVLIYIFRCADLLRTLGGSGARYWTGTERYLAIGKRVRKI